MSDGTGGSQYQTVLEVIKYDPASGDATEGWRVVSSFAVASPWTLSTSQVMILLERETPAS